MAARSTKGLQIRMTTAAAVGVEVLPTGISAAKPAVVSVADASAVLQNDLVVVPSGATGMASLDGRTFTAAAILAASFELLGSDTTGETYVPGSTPELQVYGAASLVTLCLSGLTRNAGTSTSQSVGTYCDPTATLPNPVVEAGSFDFTGYVDVADPGFRELTLAYEDGDTRRFEVILPGDGENGNGVLVFSGVVSALDYDIPVDGAIGYTGTITLDGRPRHLFD